MTWQEQGLCANSHREPSRQMCSRCPSRFACLYDGFREPVGRWGGFDARERRVFLRDASGNKDEALVAAWRSVQP